MKGLSRLHYPPIRKPLRWDKPLFCYCLPGGDVHRLLFFQFQVVVNSLLFAIPGIGNVLLVCMVFWLIFSIMGVQFFGGTFFKCIYPSGARIPVGVVPNKTVCLDKGFRWQNSNINFDNALNGFMALFQVVCFSSFFIFPLIVTSVGLRNIIHSLECGSAMPSIKYDKSNVECSRNVN